MTDEEFKLVEEAHEWDLAKMDCLKYTINAAVKILKEGVKERHQLLIEEISNLQKNDTQESSGNNDG